MNELYMNVCMYEEYKKKEEVLQQTYITFIE